MLRQMFITAVSASSTVMRELRTTTGLPLAPESASTRHPRRDASSSDDDVSRQPVLIFSSDSLSGALLGAAVELSGHAPHFAGGKELARAALLRIRPRLALIDCDHEEACAEGFIGPAMMTGAHILLIHSRRSKRDMRALAHQLGVRVLEMPPEHESLVRLLRETLAD